MTTSLVARASPAFVTAFVVFIAGLASPPLASVAVAADEPAIESAFPKAQQDAYANIYIVGFMQPALAAADRKDGSGPRLPRTASGRLDVRAPESLAYVQSLRVSQDQFLADASRTLGRELAPIAPEFRFQHAFNGMVLRMTEHEVVAVASHPDVTIVEPYTEYLADTDAGPSLIGAPGMWSGASVPSGAGTRGEGVVIGMIDSGINFDSPSFAAVEPGHPGIPGGYAHTNPFGPGNYLGGCRSGGVDVGQCNEKLIGAYDFVFTVQCSVAPPAAPCPAGTIDEPSVEDSNGHGTHTSSTAGGNAAVATFSGITVPVSGVARHANLVAYDVCYTRTSDGAGLCPNVSTLAAINQTVADGVIDVINYSISGGAQPWLEANSLAFLNAANAGIYVAASAGNSGPGPATLGHVEPWVASSGASTHNRQFGYDFDLTGPAGPPANTQNITVRPGGAPIATASVVNIPLIVSPNFGTPPSDGCSPPIGVAYPANFFRRPAAAGGTQGLAVLRLPSVGSLCASGARRTNALAAGASGVLFVVDGPTNLGANLTTWQMDNVPNWGNVQAHVSTDPSTATATILAPVAPFLTQQPDVLAAFSSRGPSGFDLLKPDVIAPGVNILAAVAGPSTAYALNSGTSMASPHHAGSAALMRAVYPAWTVAEIKSAIISTANTSANFKENGTTPADPHDRGGGRVDLSRAATTGLVMDIPGGAYEAANPAIGGDPSTLNLPGMQNDNCVGACSFTRAVRSVRPGMTGYSLAVTGFPAGAVEVTPTTFNVGLNGTATFTVDVDALQLTQNVWAFGELTLTPSSPHMPALHVPIAIRAAQPDVAITPASIAVTLPPDTTALRSLTVRNAGNPNLTWANDAAGQATVDLLAQPNNGANGFSTNFYSGQTPTPGGVYTSDDFTPQLQVSLRRIAVQGFMTGTGTQTLIALATGITFKIYSDSAGIPAGNPEAGPGGELYSCVRTTTGANSAGLTFNSADGAFYTLDLAGATGCPTGPVLGAGTPFWVAVFPTVPGNSGSRRWVWFRAIAENGSQAKIISPQQIAGATISWLPIAPVAALAATLQGEAQCGAPWLNIAPTGAVLGLAGQSDVTVTIDTTGLAPGNYAAAICVDTVGTDPDEPKTPIPVVLTVSTTATVPTGLGRSSPPVVGLGESSLLTVQVTPGELPTSTGIAVEADLTSIGGSATQAFVDNGTGGDVSAGDNVFSFNATVDPGSAVETKSFPATITDAEVRGSVANISLAVNAATLPTAFGRAFESSVTAGTIVVLTERVAPGAFPTSTGFTVIGDLSQIGGSVTQAFLDDGQNGDVFAGDRVFTFRTAVAPGTPVGALLLPVTVTDAQGRSPAPPVQPPPPAPPVPPPSSIPLTVIANTPLAGTGASSPASVIATANALLTMAVTPGTAPTSTGITVNVDLSAIGGSASQKFYDDGTRGDVTSGNNTFSFAITVPAGTAPGLKTFPAVFADAQGRTGAANISLTVLAPTSPSGVGQSNPASSFIGGTSLLTVAVTVGTNPSSTGVSVSANLSTIGGSATQALFDNGTNGDATAGDGTWSFLATVAVGTSIGTKSLAFSINDAQARTGSGSIALDILATTSPSGVGGASPATVSGTEASVLTVTTTAGTNPSSTSVGVTANLSQIGGPTVATFLDDGNLPDATAGDGIFTYQATVVLGTSGGNKLLPFTITDAQARSGSGNIALEVLASAAPSGLGAATPGSLPASASTLLTIAVTAGANPSSATLAVSADLSAIGGLSSQAFLDDGLNGDVQAGDGTYSFNATVPLSMSAGMKNVPFSVTDNFARTGSGNILVEILAPSAPSGVAAATPDAVVQGGSTLITVAVTLGQAPTSTGIIVRADLSSIGLSANQALYDDGSNGDATAGDGTYSVTANVPAATAIGAKSIGVTIQDAQGRSGSAGTTLTVQPVNLLNDGFEDPPIP